MFADAPGGSLSESQLDDANQEQDHDNDDDYADDPDATISVHLNLPVMSRCGHSAILWGTSQPDGRDDFLEDTMGNIDPESGGRPSTPKIPQRPCLWLDRQRRRATRRRFAAAI